MTGLCLDQYLWFHDRYVIGMLHSLGILGLTPLSLGISSFFIIHLSFGKAVDDFKQSVELQGDTGQHPIAEHSNGFTIVWVGYTVRSIPLVCALAKFTLLPPLLVSRKASFKTPFLILITS